MSWREGRKWGPRKRGELKNEKLTAAAAVPVTVLSAVVVLSDVAGLLLAAAAAATAAVSPVAVSAATTTPASSVSTASAVAAAASTLGAGEGKSWIFVRGVGFGKEKGEEEQEVEFLVFRIDARDLEKKKSLRLKNEKIFHSPLEQHNSARTARAAERLYILRPAGVKETEKEREREREREEKRREEKRRVRRGEVGRTDSCLPNDVRRAQLLASSAKFTNLDASPLRRPFDAPSSATPMRWIFAFLSRAIRREKK